MISSHFEKSVFANLVESLSSFLYPHNVYTAIHTHMSSNGLLETTTHFPFSDQQLGILWFV
jgi:hypothetical protein